ncbi:Hsp20/alpha crystallin family protein [Alicyclobacillus tolerans]|uniref:HSP20 family protein n=2 Tax=Alicyclobacillus tolerans TaxID=90970 RepID=A0ABT9LVM5_9BACL|nr:MULTISPECIES: Hsp20/alpha crystallin family protein [Alicyclobacillus]MDP9728241.1 HSP20 family protein [Alicyclobacillus tengchongensis]SHJ81624.1 Molecular chaperone IbpA, HSP20 family [Alicyclobacillus montanus]
MANQNDSNFGWGNFSNPFEMLKNMGDLRDWRKLLGEDFFKNMPFPQMQQGNPSPFSGGHEVYPPVDMYDRGHELVVVLDVPGASSANDIKIRVSDRQMIIRGRSTDFSGKDDTALQIERHHGPFERIIEFPVRVHSDKVIAHFKDGVLLVRIQKIAQPGDDFDEYVPIQFE